MTSMAAMLIDTARIKVAPRIQPGSILLLLTMLVVICVPADLLLLRNGADDAACYAITIGALCAVALAIRIVWSERENHLRLMRIERQHIEAFRNASVSIWMEDWSEVGRIVLESREAGVDLVERFRTDQELVRRLHRTVLVVDVNDATVELVGAPSRAAMIGRLADIVPASAGTFSAWLAALARGDRSYRAESQVMHADGSLRDCIVMALLPVDRAGFERLPISVLDVTNYKADQARLLRAEQDAARVSRLLTVGVLTGSIAHEVNNPLAATITSAEAALRWLARATPDVAEAQDAMHGAITAARRAQDVVDRTRRLVTRGLLETQRVDAAALLECAAAVMARELREARVVAVIRIAPDTPLLDVDPVRVQQVLLNLLQNAVRAARPSDTGRYVHLVAEPHGEWVRITVADNGTGIPAFIRSTLFEPFTTTRAEGMGLGLAVCKACVEVHGGHLWVEDQPPGADTVFHFTLPAAGGEART